MNFKLINIKYLKISQNTQKKPNKLLMKSNLMMIFQKNLKGKNYKKKKKVE